MLGIRKYWYGKEIEGRFSDVETLFIGTIKAKIEMDKVKVPHVYFCSPAVEELIKSKEWDMVLKMIDNHNKIVTLEVKPGMLKDIPPMVRIRTHILFMLEEEDAQYLTDNDSIKVVYGDYKLYITSIQNMQKVTPDSYKFDRIKE